MIQCTVAKQRYVCGTSGIVLRTLCEGHSFLLGVRPSGCLIEPVCQGKSAQMRLHWWERGRECRSGK